MSVCVFLGISQSFGVTKNAVPLFLAAGYHMRNSKYSVQTPASLFSPC